MRKRYSQASLVTALVLAVILCTAAGVAMASPPASAPCPSLAHIGRLAAEARDLGRTFEEARRDAGDCGQHQHACLVAVHAAYAVPKASPGQVYDTIMIGCLRSAEANEENSRGKH